MPSFLSRLHVRSRSSAGDAKKSHITNQAIPSPRTEIGPASDHLEEQLLALYWEAVARDLPHILLTLQRWQSDFQPLPEENDHIVQGFDAWVDRVTQHSNAKTRPQLDKDDQGSYTATLENRAWDILTDLKSERIKKSIRVPLHQRPTPDALRRRARMLLQSAQWLDIDKLIEHREPPKQARLAPAQRRLPLGSDASSLAIKPLLCSECHLAIRGSQFVNLENKSIAVCESCYRAHYYGQTNFSKIHKTCCLTTDVTVELSQRLCRCSNVAHEDSKGSPRALWPINVSHLGTSRGSCRLPELPDMLAEAKYASTRLKSDRGRSLRQHVQIDEKREHKASVEHWKKRAKNEKWKPKPQLLRKTGDQVVNEFGTQREEDPEWVRREPEYLCAGSDTSASGATPASLRIGPLIIENGAPK